MRRTWFFISIIVAILTTVSTILAASTAIAQGATPPAGKSEVTLVASGLTNPRGFAWGPDGTLVMALAGSGGDNHLAFAPGVTADLGLTSSIVTIAGGCATPMVQGLVSALWEEPDWVWGAMDVAFIGNDLYVLVSGAGPSWGSPSSRSGVSRVNSDGTMTLVADLTTWLPHHLPKFVPPDYSSDGSLFDLEATNNALILSEAVGGLIIKVTPAGDISTVADLSDQHPVPTGIAVDADGSVYVGYEDAAPYPDGASKVTKIAPDGTITDAWTGLTRLGDVTLGPDGTLYAAELSTGNSDTAPYFHPGIGKIVRQTGPDSSEVVADGLDYPVYLGFGADGALYVDGPANGADAGEGWLTRIDWDGEMGSPVPATPCVPMATPTA